MAIVALRRILLLSILVLASSVMLPGAAAAERLFVTDTSDGYLNLRSGPGTDHSIVARLYGGTEVDGVGQSGSWRRIVLPDGTTGWASGNFLTPSYRQMRHYDYFVLPTSDGYLNLRTGPGTSYPIIQRLYAGQGLLDGGSQNGWIYVTLPDKTAGWASETFIQ